MTTRDAAPVVGDWYRRLDRSQAFQVVAVDGPAGTVDIEYFDGTIDEWPISHWHHLPIEPCEAPQDSSGPFDAADGDAADEQGIEDHPQDLGRFDQGPIETADELTVPSHARVFEPRTKSSPRRGSARPGSRRRR